MRPPGVFDVYQQFVRTKEIRAEEGKGDIGREKITPESLASKAQVRSLCTIRADGCVVSGPQLWTVDARRVVLHRSRQDAPLSAGVAKKLAAGECVPDEQ